MAEWSRKKVNSGNINNGKEYEKDDNVVREQLNAMVNTGLYSQDFAEKLVTNIDTSEVGNVGTPSVSLITGDGATTDKPYKKFKFSNLKGDTGVTPNITVTATTLPAGSPATVTKSGTAENPVFTFGIPKGQDGLNGSGINPNLLINGDFRVNQRGQTSYTGTGYTVDRWRNVGFNNLTVTSINTGISLVDTLDTGTGYILSYKFEDKDYLKLQGKTITISFKVSKNTGIPIYIRLLANGENVGGTENTTNTGIFSTTITLPTSLSALEFQIRKSKGELNCEIEYAKLELGSVATPNNSRPYAEELALCQRYYQDCRINIAVLANTITNLYPNIPLIQTLRTNPTITITTMPSLRGNGSGIDVFTISSITFNSLRDNSLQLLCKLDNSTPVQSNYVYQLVNGNLTIDAEIY